MHDLSFSSNASHSSKKLRVQWPFKNAVWYSDILHRWSGEMIRSKTIISEGKWWRSIAWSIAARRNSGIRAQQLTQNNRSSYFNPISPVTPSSQLTTLLSSTPIYHFQRASKTCLSFVKLRFTWLNMPSWLIPRHFASYSYPLPLSISFFTPQYIFLFPIRVYESSFHSFADRWQINIRFIDDCIL